MDETGEDRHRSVQRGRFAETGRSITQMLSVQRKGRVRNRNCLKLGSKLPCPPSSGPPCRQRPSAKICHFAVSSRADIASDDKTIVHACLSHCHSQAVDASKDLNENAGRDLGRWTQAPDCRITSSRRSARLTGSWTRRPGHQRSVSLRCISSAKTIHALVYAAEETNPVYAVEEALVYAAEETSHTARNRRLDTPLMPDPPFLSERARLGALSAFLGADDSTVCNATGTHRPDEYAAAGR